MVYLLTQDESAIYDFEKYGFIATDKDGSVLMGGGNEIAYIIGKYASQERANQVVSEIFSVGLDMSRYEMPVV